MVHIYKFNSIKINIFHVNIYIYNLKNNSLIKMKIEKYSNIQFHFDFKSKGGLIFCGLQPAIELSKI